MSATVISTKQYWEQRAYDYGEKAPHHLEYTDEQIQEEFEVLSPFFDEHIEKDKTLLDAGCGVGRFKETLERKCDEYYGIDFSRNMLEQTDGTRIQGDLAHLPFTKRQFDNVVTFVVLQHIVREDRFDQAMKELVRVCRKRIYIYDAVGVGDYRNVRLDHIIIRPLHSYIRHLLPQFEVDTQPGPFPHSLIMAQRRWWR